MSVIRDKAGMILSLQWKVVLDNEGLGSGYPEEMVISRWGSVVAICPSLIYLSQALLSAILLPVQRNS